jgi:hypothetical protein
MKTDIKSTIDITTCQKLENIISGYKRKSFLGISSSGSFKPIAIRSSSFTKARLSIRPSSYPSTEISLSSEEKSSASFII